MKTKVRWAIGILLAIGAAGCGGWFYVASLSEVHYVPISKAEIAQYLGKDLVVAEVTPPLPTIDLKELTSLTRDSRNAPFYKAMSVYGKTIDYKALRSMGQQSSKALSPLVANFGSMRIPFAYSPMAMDFPDMAGLKAVAKLLSFQAIVAAKNQDTEGAFKAITANLAFTEACWRSAPKSFVHCMVVIAIEAIALRSLHQALFDTDFSRSQLAKFQGEMDRLTDPIPLLKKAIVREFSGTSSELLTKQFTQRELIQVASVFAPEGSFPLAGTFDQKATFKLASNLTREIINNLGLPLSERQYPLSNRTDAVLDSMPDGTHREDAGGIALEWKRINFQRRLGAMPNAIGLNVLASSFFRTTLPFELKALACRRLTHAVLAAFRYRKAHGEYPSTLAELGPIEKDPYANEPLKYDRTRKLVWSVGDNGKDDNGKHERYMYGLDFAFDLP